jgi:hypothetical protein
MTSEPDTDPEEEAASDDPLPEETVETAERLTRLARDAIDENEAEAYEAERAALLADHDYTARLRGDDHGETLVLHPSEWETDGKISVDRVDDVGRAVEVPLDGTGDPDAWEDVEAHNREVAAHIEETHGPVHGANAQAFADFMGNHYARPVEEATAAMVREFIEEYFIRNAWPSDEQRAVIEESVELVRDAGHR